MRCLTLADALRTEGVSVRFICRKTPGNLGGLIKERGHEVAWLVDRFDEENDAHNSQAALSDQTSWEWLIVDHYALGARWESALRESARRIMAIDDLADRPHACDLLLDQNLQPAGRYDALVPRDCLRLLGPAYALLRPQFLQARQALPERQWRVSSILVFFGGIDATGESLKALSALASLADLGITNTVVVGSNCPHAAAINSACEALPSNRLLRQVENMAELMAQADLFLGAGGSASWERCCLGLPGLIVATAPNQIELSLELAKAGAQIYLGKAESVSAERLAESLREVVSRPETLRALSETSLKLVDGRGTQRILKHLL